MSKKQDGRTWIGLSQDRGVLSTVMSIWVPYNVWNFMIRSVAINFPRNNMLFGVI
jgi:hypothetical protein